MEESKIFKNAISEPMAETKLSSRLLKLVKKLSKSDQKRQIACKAKEEETGKKGGRVREVLRGVKEVVKAIKKGTKGLCLITGDISPIEVIAHLPVLCENKEVPYIYIPSRDQLGTACLTKRPTSCVLLTPTADSSYLTKYNKLVKKIKQINPYL